MLVLSKAGRRAVAAALTACACAVLPAAAGAYVTENADVTRAQVNPATTGIGIDNESLSSNFHRVWTTTDANRKNLLFLFLGGTGSSPSFYEQIGITAANAGFDAIDLRWPDSQFAASVCPDTLSAADGDACYAADRGETLFGTGSTYGLLAGEQPWGPVQYGSGDALAVDLPNSVVNRTVALLRYTGLSQYLVADPSSPYPAGAPSNQRAYPKWTKIVISGHSQGGTNALFVSKRLKVRRAAALSGPEDWVAGRSAAWIAAPSVTSTANQYALRNTHEDNGNLCDHCGANWGALKLPGSDTSVDTSTPPYGSSHRLTTSTRARSCLGVTCTAINYHDSTAVDSAVLYENGGLLQPPSLTPAWLAMFTGNGSD